MLPDVPCGAGVSPQGKGEPPAAAKENSQMPVLGSRGLIMHWSHAGLSQWEHLKERQLCTHVCRKKKEGKKNNVHKGCVLFGCTMG